ncbi:uncharacterized protein [Bemisia tabaci]|uniref:uncharacterized protein n=1 Tax=Bemisia tabaci TaxID=7038 RepID=UPI003B28CCB6
MLVLFTLFFIYNCKCTKSMTAALGCSIALIFISIEASPTPVPQSKSYDELLDTLRALETNRKSLLKKAVEEAANQKCNGTSKFLEIIEIADEVLVSIRDYFEAGKLMLDLNKGKLSIYQPDVIAKTQPLRDEHYLQNKMVQLSFTLKRLQAQMDDLSEENLLSLKPVIVAFKQSEKALNPIAKKFTSDLIKLRKTAVQ